MFWSCFSCGFGKVIPSHDDGQELAQNVEVTYIPPRGVNRGTPRSMENPMVRIEVVPVPSHTWQQSQLTCLLTPTSNPGSKSDRRGSDPAVQLGVRSSKDPEGPRGLAETSADSQCGRPASRMRRGSVESRDSIPSSQVPFDKRRLTAGLSIPNEERRSRLGFSERGANTRPAAPGPAGPETLSTPGSKTSRTPRTSVHFPAARVDGRRASMSIAPRIASLTASADLTPRVASLTATIGIASLARHGTAGGNPRSRLSVESVAPNDAGLVLEGRAN